MSLSKRLKFHRKKAGFSQSSLAELLQISRQSISKWENGRGYPGLDNLILLSELYGLSVDDLLKEKLKKKNIENKISAKQQTSISLKYN